MHKPVSLPSRRGFNTPALLSAFFCLVLGAIAALPAAAMTPEQIIAALQRPENSTGNIADAVEEATGARGWMSSDMKPIYDARIVGRAATALMRPVLKNDTRKYPNHILDILDEAPAGSVLVYVMQDGLEIAAMGNLMGTTAKVRGLEGAVSDGPTKRRVCHAPVFGSDLSGLGAPFGEIHATVFAGVDGGKGFFAHGDHGVARRSAGEPDARHLRSDEVRRLRR